MDQHFTYSAPGRTEIIGNHTDHQHGCVLAAAVNLETVADVELTESGKSSWTYLQNIYPAGETELQPVAVALAMCDTLLQGKGAYRVHGGGFAGTVQAFVPFDMLEDFKQNIEAVLGMDSCHVLSIRSEGGIRLE